MGFWESESVRLQSNHPHPPGCMHQSVRTMRIMILGSTVSVDLPPVPGQALEEERLGPRRQPYSDERQKRLAVQEAATALVCTLMPAIEPVTMVRCCCPSIAESLTYTPVVP